MAREQISPGDPRYRCICTNPGDLRVTGHQPYCIEHNHHWTVDSPRKVPDWTADDILRGQSQTEAARLRGMLQGLRAEGARFSRTEVESAKLLIDIDRQLGRPIPDQLRMVAEATPTIEYEPVRSTHKVEGTGMVVDVIQHRNPVGAEYVLRWGREVLSRVVRFT